MKFAMCYSCGKDSTLALHKMLEQGHQPVCLVTMVNRQAGRSYFHGADETMLQCYEQALGLPLIGCPTDGPGYQAVLEAGLAQAKEMGAQGVCFGDIDIEQNRQWEQQRCQAVGLEACFPLWQQGRQELVFQLLALGYQCLIKTVDRRLLPASLAGQLLSRDTLEQMRRAGVDLCGENGEYHTLAIDGPVFRHPLPFQVGQILELEHYAVADIRCVGLDQ